MEALAYHCSREGRACPGGLAAGCGEVRTPMGTHVLTTGMASDGGNGGVCPYLNEHSNDLEGFHEKDCERSFTL